MQSNAEFDGESDFAIKRGPNPRFDWVTEGQSQNLVKWRPNDVPGMERVNPYLTTYAHVRLSIFHRESPRHTFLLRILSSYVGKYPYFAYVE